MTAGDEEPLAHVPLVPYQGLAYRQQPPGFAPRSGAGALREGGRFNPANSFPVLYLALSIETAAADLRGAAEGIGLSVEAVLPRELFQYDVDLTRVLDLHDEETLQTIHATAADLLAADRTSSQSIGALAARMDAQAILCPSATGCGEILAVLIDNLSTGACEPQLLTTWMDETDVSSARTTRQ